ncbi:MAG: FliA/WhiG family RNA polymerase sigma factor [Acidimicrobiia bacterium]
MQRVQDPSARTSIEDRLPEYRGLVRQIAVQVASGIPRHVELDELVSAGTLGLVEAARRFDPDRGVRFEAFVAERVRGAIIDFLRSVDWAPRSVRSAAKRIDEATTRLTCELGRTPSSAELAADLEMSVDDLQHYQGALVQSVVLALDRGSVDNGDDDSESIGSSLADTGAPLPEDVIEQKELAGYLVDAVNCLPEQARTVIALYYLDGMHMARIGDLLGVTQSRASQIHSAALALLRDAISAQLDPEHVEPPEDKPGRRAKRIAQFHEEVAAASDYRQRIGGPRRVNLDLSYLLAAVDEDGDDSDRERWQLIMTKSHEIAERRRQGRLLPAEVA